MAQLEVWDDHGQTFFRLEGDAVLIGRSADCGLILSQDGAISRHHAKLTRQGPSLWMINDLGSQNGTWINGVALHGERALRHQDEVTLGQKVRLVFRDPPPDLPEASTFPAAGGPPKLTGTQFNVLKELLRPVIKPDRAVPVPATEQEIAERMFVTRGAVRAQLQVLYDKFCIEDTGKHDRRYRLAEEAKRRNAIKPSDCTDD
jgi:pSer/pThr/pTyr-binding forkhead associated (FHA) protein